MSFIQPIPRLIIILPLLQALPVLPRLSLSDGWSSYDQRDHFSDAYTFGYDLEDPNTRNVQFRQEERFPNGTTVGSYGLLEPDGNVKIVHYVADNFGYRVFIENSKSLSQNYPPITMPLVEHKEYEPFSDYDTYPSDELMAAVESTMTLGQTILEQHTPPKYYHQLPEWQNSIDNKRFRLNNNNNNNYDYVNSLNFK